MTLTVVGEKVLCRGCKEVIGVMTVKAFHSRHKGRSIIVYPPSAVTVFCECGVENHIEVGNVG